MDTMYGTIERGKILEETSEGYTVGSIDREGIVTQAIKPIDAKNYARGDLVYFFAFCDGTGRIVCHM